MVKKINELIAEFDSKTRKLKQERERLTKLTEANNAEKRQIIDSLTRPYEIATKYGFEGAQILEAHQVEEVGVEFVDSAIQHVNFKHAEFMTLHTGSLLGEDQQLEIREFHNALHQLNKVKENLTTFSFSIALRTAQLETKQDIVKQLVGETDTLQRQIDNIHRDRKNLVRALSASLEDYLSNRPSAYKVKDKLSPADITVRTNTILQLKELLDEYSFSGTEEDQDLILKYIKDNVAKFSGVHLSTLLHRITIELLDRETKDAEKPNHAQVLAGLNDHNNKGYSNKIVNLYHKITALADFGDTLTDKEKEQVAKLARKLRDDVDQFVTKTGGYTPTAKALSAFKEKIIARLHTEDIAMSQHSKFFSLLKDIVKAVFSIGATLVHNKMTTGRFFSKTASEQAIASLDKNINELPKGRVIFNLEPQPPITPESGPKEVNGRVDATNDHPLLPTF